MRARQLPVLRVRLVAIGLPLALGGALLCARVLLSEDESAPRTDVVAFVPPGVSGYVLQKPEPPPKRIVSPEGVVLQGPVKDVNALDETVKSALPILGVGVGAVMLLGGVFLLGRARTG